MILKYIDITNYSINCKSCKATTTIKYVTECNTNFCDKCISNSKIKKKKDLYTPTLIGNYEKNTFRNVNFSSQIVEKQLKEIKK